MAQLQTVDQSPSADELKRIVEVAEHLGEDPQIVRNILEDEDHKISTDIDLVDSIEIVERKLAHEERTVEPDSPWL